MYENYWGLKEKPFENTPDPRFLYYSQQHKEALARLLYVVREHKGAALITGEYGSGKTLLSRVLWHELQQEHKYKAVFILNPRLSGLEFIQETVHQLSSGEVIPPPTKIELFHALHKILYANYNLGRHSVITVDEAQAIENKEIFEELRLLLNFQLDNAFLLTIILLGQPELKATVINLPQLNQRMSVRFHIKGLSAPETKEYILHRLKVAGAKKPIFAEKSFEQIFYSSLGIPRRINNICDLALLVGCGNNLETVDKNTVVKVCEDLGDSSTDASNFHSSSALAPEDDSEDSSVPKKTSTKRK